MPTLDAIPFNPAHDYAVHEWVTPQVHAFYVQQRMANCSYLELMDLWMHEPWCEDCHACDNLVWQRLPDIHPSSWAFDLAWVVGMATLKRTSRARKSDPDFCWHCHKCGCELRPWRGKRRGQAVYVETQHVEESFSVRTETPGKVEPPEWLRKRVFSFYGNACFACGETDRTKLHIDHVRPRAHGGDAAFRNLQPLCAACGARKGNQLPETIQVYSDMFFGPLPADSYDGLFWDADELLGRSARQ